MRRLSTRPLRDWAAGASDARFRFRCTRCGKCCTGRGGRVRVNERELRALAAATGESPAGARRKFLRPSDRKGEWLLRQAEDDARCVFLEGARCAVYAARPTQCRTYPWWPQHLVSDYDWRVAAAECEGISADTTVDGDGPDAQVDALSFDDVAPQVIAHDIHRSGENYTHPEMMELLQEMLAADDSFVQGFKDEFFASFSRRVVFQDEEVAVLDTVLGEDAAPTRCFVFKDRLQLIQSEVVLDRQSGTPDRTNLTLEVHRALCVPFMWLPNTLENSTIAVLGAGASTLPLFLLHHLPSIRRIDAVEPNEHVIQIANELFGVKQFQDEHPARLILHQQFGEEFLSDRLRDNTKYDMIVVDVDSGKTLDGIAAPPPSMITDQFLGNVKQLLAPEVGIAAFNVIAESEEALRNIRARLQAVFPHGVVLQLRHTRNTVFYLFCNDEDGVSARATENLSERLALIPFQANNAQTAELIASASELVGQW